MARFSVTVNRIGYAQKTIVVEADSEEQAREAAIDEAGNLSFSEHSSEYEVEAIQTAR